eukprot:COSAG05_NODE_11482_length_511_cov_0.995146_1_plen_132_part_10
MSACLQAEIRLPVWLRIAAKQYGAVPALIIRRRRRQRNRRGRAWQPTLEVHVLLWFQSAADARLGQHGTGGRPWWVFTYYHLWPSSNDVSVSHLTPLRAPPDIKLAAWKKYQIPSFYGGLPAAHSAGCSDNP